MCFSHCSDVKCPVCPTKTYTTRGGKVREFRPELECTEQNYSGCGVDIGQCPECKKFFQIAYHVAGVTELDW